MTEPKPSNRKTKLKMISVYPSTYARLRELGKMGESFDSVINRYLPSKVVVVTDRRPSNTWQCAICGNFITTFQNPGLYECKECGAKGKWRQGEF